MNAVVTNNLTKYYGKARGIVDVSLTVKEGDFFGFIGPNGAGKSTTIRTLLGLIAPTGGSAEIFGKDIRKHRTELLADIGYLPSETMFYSGMRVKDVLRLSARLRGTDCSEEAGKLCERLELDTSRKIEELSLGNRKKAGIVCALQHRPKLYILDEPTSGLDPLMQREFFEILRERNRAGVTVFLSSHILSEIQRYCSRAAIIREGRIITCGAVTELAKTNARRVSLRGNPNLAGLSGIKDVKRSDDQLSFLYGGDLNALLHALAKSEIADLTIAEPDLEEIFLHYYETEDTQV